MLATGALRGPLARLGHLWDIARIAARTRCQKSPLPPVRTALASMKLLPKTSDWDGTTRFDTKQVK